MFGSSPPALPVQQRPSPTIARHSYLDSLNLVVNKEFRFLACEQCQQWISVDNVKHHTLKKHAHLSLDQARLKRAIEDVQATDDLIKSMSGPRTVVHGLAVHDACHVITAAPSTRAKRRCENTTPRSTMTGLPRVGGLAKHNS